ncbi:MAG: ankyrin repeat domain-containing protein [Syntrophobacteraceae bacterium]
MSFLSKIFKGSLDGQLWSAIYKEPDKVASLLKKGANANARTSSGFTPLMQASQWDDLGPVKALLEYGADVNSTDFGKDDFSQPTPFFYNGGTALMIAASKGNINVTKELLKNNADPDIKDKYGKTAIVHAIVSFNDNRLKILETLLNHDADPNVSSDEGETALITAVNSSNQAPISISRSIIDLLLKNEADVNACDSRGYTALLHAAQNGDAHTVGKLLENGADPGHESDSGDTALSLTEDGKVKSLIQAALNRNPEGKMKVHCAKSDYTNETKKRIEQFSMAADAAISRSFKNKAFNLHSEIEAGTVPSFIKQLDVLLEEYPDDEDILFAESEAHVAMMDGERGSAYLEKVLAVNSDHFDAKMRRDCPEWVNIFAYPGWYDGIKSVPEITLAVQNETNILQLVRDGLTVSPVALVPINADDLPGKIVDAKWRPVWVNSKAGAAFFHYVLFKVEDYDKPGLLEYMVFPYPFDVPRPMDGYWLLERLCRQDRVWIAFNDGEKILYNKKYAFEASEKSNLDIIRKDLKELNRDDESMAKFSAAVQIHQMGSDMDSLSKW